MPNGNGETQKNPPSGEFDSRLQFLLQSSESLHANLQELYAQMAEQNSELARHKKATDERFDKLLSATESLLAITRERLDRLDKLEGDKP
jgi:hypothetical protein